MSEHVLDNTPPKVFFLLISLLLIVTLLMLSPILIVNLLRRWRFYLCECANYGSESELGPLYTPSIRISKSMSPCILWIPNIPDL
ncbi:hypothetical protein HID58_090059 [Brassica napus]|uniref:Uncharacterized protein n=1 Tax=Brassica napus TaxID=3708 RepID=A0ABQ7XG91_BRANA|nr:hypothetical protein HID58_090059 [Brassica napus]